VARARQLVADALDRGASRDDAQGMLERIERLGIGQTAPARRRRSLPLPAPDPDARLAAASQTGLRRVRGRMAAVLLLVAALGVLAVGLLGFTVPESWTLAGLSTASSGPSSTVVSTTPEPLPVPRASEAFLSRGRALLATGRLRDALDQIDRIPIGDPLRADADRLRAAVQRELLAVAAAEQPATATPDALPALRPPE
jgi:hypothetical protein